MHLYACTSTGSSHLQSTYNSAPNSKKTIQILKGSQQRWLRFKFGCKLGQILKGDNFSKRCHKLSDSFASRAGLDKSKRNCSFGVTELLKKDICATRQSIVSLRDHFEGPQSTAVYLLLHDNNYKSINVLNNNNLPCFTSPPSNRYITFHWHCLKKQGQHELPINLIFLFCFHWLHYCIFFTLQSWAELATDGPRQTVFRWKTLFFISLALKP